MVCTSGYLVHFTQPPAHALCQPSLIVGTSDKKYKSGACALQGISLTKHVGLYTHAL